MVFDPISNLNSWPTLLEPPSVNSILIWPIPKMVPSQTSTSSNLPCVLFHSGWNPRRASLKKYGVVLKWKKTHFLLWDVISEREKCRSGYGNAIFLFGPMVHWILGWVLKYITCGQSSKDWWVWCLLSMDVFCSTRFWTMQWTIPSLGVSIPNYISTNTVLTLSYAYHTDLTDNPGGMSFQVRNRLSVKLSVWLTSRCDVDLWYPRCIESKSESGRFSFHER